MINEFLTIFQLFYHSDILFDHVVSSVSHFGATEVVDTHAYFLESRRKTMMNSIISSETTFYI